MCSLFTFPHLPCRCAWHFTHLSPPFWFFRFSHHPISDISPPAWVIHGLQFLKDVPYCRIVLSQAANSSEVFSLQQALWQGGSLSKSVPRNPSSSISSSTYPEASLPQNSCHSLKYFWEQVLWLVGILACERLLIPDSQDAVCKWHMVAHGLLPQRSPPQPSAS